ncbi:MmgE/PrpD family protein [Sphingomonas sp. BIUV-7]|uniref:MmgE/PrpD family protein n=1 Tax=Sphingomonas natans TaxID=3063330 RepID=A0ABT8YA87_9SPHN|nr:MmgE/PrpD family protein [Sphingomonas sp. BIUV-7]MDO6415246.1 MmgE/PrpD family protein [Sphingomonas sp. BIUV-7]
MGDAIGLSETLARHVATYDAAALPDTTIHAAKRALLDGIGVMLGASGVSSEVVPFVEYAISGGHGDAAVLGHDVRVTPAMAAFANGAMAHALDFEDAFDAAPSHPNASLLPAVLATLGTAAPVSGRELLTAIAIGCDLACRIGLALTRDMEVGGWYPPPIRGAFGAVAAAARIQRLSTRQTLDAFSLLLCQTTMPGEIKYSADTVIRAVREAFPAQSAVQASQLAARGVRGFDAPFEGKAGFFRLYADGHYDPSRLLDRLGEHFWIDRLTFKRWPACRGTHAYIEAAQYLRAQHSIDPAAIFAVTATGGEVQRMLVEPADRKAAPTTAIDAKFSIPFTVAAALLDDEVTLDSYDLASLADVPKRDLAARVRFELRPDWGMAQAASGILSIQLADGVRYKHTIEDALGGPDRPIDDDRLTAKFRDCARRAKHPMSDAQAEQLAAAIWSIDEAGDAAIALKL